MPIRAFLLGDLMKYKVGDLLFIKKYEYKLRLRLRLRLPPRPHLRLRPLIQNTFGIITEVEKHTDLFEKDSTENNNGYIWYSQVDGKEYYFYQDEVDGEVIS
jgi:hypothetical protein